MKIQRVIAKNWKALRDRDDLFAAGPDRTPWQTLCLKGINGSGKTTYLEVVAMLWEHLRSWARTLMATQGDLEYGEAGHDEDDGRDALIAMLVTDLPGPRPALWIVYGSERLWHGVSIDRHLPVVGYLADARSGSMTGDDVELARFWEEHALRLELGARDATPVPNMVLLRSEQRYVLPLERGELGQLQPDRTFQWLARYTPTDSVAGHLENSLSALLTVDRAEYEKLAKLLHRIWPEVELLDRADRRTLRPLFRLRSGTVITLDQLSAGERSMLVMLFSVARWLMPGGVVLVDEPELHLHLSLQRTLLVYLEMLVAERAGQLIVASHAPSVWEHFYRGRGIVDLSPIEPAEAAA